MLPCWCCIWPGGMFIGSWAADATAMSCSTKVSFAVCINLAAMAVLLGLGRFLIADEGLDFVVLLLGKDANHRHHAHHACAPVGGQAVGLRLGDTGSVVHAHFHESVLRKAGNGVGVLGDR